LEAVQKQHFSIINCVCDFYLGSTGKKNKNS